MNEQLSRAFGQIKDIVLNRMTGTQRIVSASILAVSIIGLAWVISSNTGTTWASAGTIENPAELRAAIKALEERKLTARMGDGNSVEVEVGQVGEARMVLMAFAEDTGANVGMELFDKSTFGQSARQEQINYVRALEGELARSIRTMEVIRSARVHLAMPEKTVFIREEKKPTASVTLVLESGRDLDKKQVRAIQRLVANAVPGMVREGVAVVGGDGELLSQGQDDQGADGGFELKNQIEREMERKLLATLERIVGVGKARVQVAAAIDYSQVTENVTEVDPERQVIRREDVTNENSVTDSPDVTGVVGMSGNDPQRQENLSKPPKSSKNKKREEREYDNSMTKRVIVQGGARLKQLSVSVVVDGVWTGEGDKASWAARSDPELQAITQAVKVGSGLDEKRGDQVSVVSLKFEDQDIVDEITEEPAVSPFMLEMIRWGIGVFIVLLFIFGVVRPFLALLRKPTEAPAAVAALPEPATPSTGAETALALNESDAPDGTEEDDMKAKQNGDGTPREPETPLLTRGEQLRLKAIEATKQNPARAVELVRAWLTREA
ncbi:MAG: flagellar M-ring protein FliF [Myxococcales bacterium]|nr:flagellar M-ring protein FliF [Myxococcales bacterium]